MLPRDSENPPYRTGDEPLTGLVSFVVTIPAELWYQGAWMDSQLSMTQERNWQQAGTVPIEDALNAANDSYIRIVSMVGMIFLWAGITDPPFAALPCDGSEYERAEYPALYAMLAAFQTGPDTFNTPDMRERVPMGSGSGLAIGDTLGEANHLLTTSEMPNHVHSTGNWLDALAVAPGELPVLVPNPFPTTTGDTGGGEPHNNIQPSLVLEYWIMAI